MAKKNKKSKEVTEDQESKVVVATSNMELLNEVFKEGGLPSFQEQFAKMAEAMAKQFEKVEESSPTTEEGQDG